jgi:hypothetical protein
MTDEADDADETDRAARERERRVDAFIERWHNAPPGELDGALHEELGWTWDEYAAYFDHGVLPPEREGAL